MIDALLAKRFIERLAQYTEYNINIMDERGIIIASKNTSRIGTFHEVALQIIQGNKDTIVVDDENARFGVKKGVNMAIYYKKRKEGVVGVTGEPDEVMQIALIIKMSVEVMLEHEFLKFEKIQRRNLKEQLLNSILYNEDFHEGDRARFTQPLQLKEDILRIPILISIERGEDINEDVLNILRNGQKHNSQDLSCLTGDGDILLYKALDGKPQDMMQQYKYLVGEAISDALRYMRSAGRQYSVYVGTFQNNFRYYRRGYSHCEWMKKEMDKTGSYYFYDHCNQYFMSVLPLTEFQTVYDNVEKILGDKLTESFKEIMEALRQSNFSLNEASKLLHVHKNTLTYRLDKIRDLLDLDPLGQNQDREFANGFYYYLKRKEKLYRA